MAPTFDVNADGAVSGTPISEISEPTPEVATCPVKGTPIPTINDPTPEVATCPVGDTEI